MTVSVLGTRWSVAAREDGRFTIALPSGRWRLTIGRIGYLSDTVEVVVPATGPVPPVEVRLAPAAVVLPGLTASVRAPAMAATVTTETVRQVPPLGEPDVFRAVATLPGISQPNDLKGRTHLAGGSSDETGIRLDGHPLQAPFHLLGLAGAFNAAALDRADIRIHHLPPEFDGQLSGVIDLRTRRPTGSTYRESVTGLLSSGITVADAGMPGDIDLLVSARITYIDKVIAFLAPQATAGGDQIPLPAYRDAVVRIGRDLPRGWRAEAIAFHTRDALRFTSRDSADSASPLSWGESLIGATLRRSTTRWEWTARLGLNRASVLKGTQGDNHVFVRSTRDWLSGAAQMTARTEHVQWNAGVSLDRHAFVHEWRTTGLGRAIFAPRTPDTFRGNDALPKWSAFVEADRDFGTKLSLAAGSRLWWVEGHAYPAPRLLATYRPHTGVRVEAALNRRFQFDAESEEPIEGNVTPPVFLLRTPRMLDVAAVSAEWEPAAPPAASRGSVHLGAFYKRYRDRAVLPELTADGSLDPFPGFERVNGTGAGIILGGRWARGDDVLVQGGYTYQRVHELIQGTWSRTGWDTPHDVSLLASARAFHRWHLNAAYRGHSGRATTPVGARVYVPTGEFGNFLQSRYIRGGRNSVRVPAYHRVDIGTRRSWEARGAEWTFFAQVLNVLFQDNPVDYDWGQYFASLEDPSISRHPRRGLPILPSLGIEVRW